MMMVILINEAMSLRARTIIEAARALTRDDGERSRVRHVHHRSWNRDMDRNLHRDMHRDFDWVE